MPDFQVYHQPVKEVNDLTQQIIILDHFSTDGNKSMHEWVASAKGKNVLLIFPVLEMKHLQFLNGKQQDSHGNFVSQLNKIFNKKYSLKNDLYRIYRRICHQGPLILNQKISDSRWNLKIFRNKYI